VGARTDAARAAAVASRGELAEEVARLEAAGRAAVDIPAKIRQAPARTAGLAAGVAFLAAGGPKRVVRGLRRAVLGPEADLPKSMLPRDVDRTLRKLGSDGEKVRGTLEREFANYLDEKAGERRKRDVSATAALLAASVLGPVSKRLGTRLAEELFTPKTAGSGTFDAAVQRARGRWSGGTTGAETQPGETQPGETQPGETQPGEPNINELPPAGRGSEREPRVR
jgi:hypothetical protein